ncbi:MAG: metalloregulator ArsR/SmtB family transcription factor [Actinomycetota bacterium]|nr:metalloregulator ArsR/SmtB family transcription factor [Actinomycetota bacterium]
MPLGRPSIIESPPASLTDTELTARLFRTLGDGTRLRIVELLAADGELHQMEIVRRLGATQARVSEHMACLTWCGFVSARIEGRRTLYRVDDPDVLALVRLAKNFLERNEAQIGSCRVIDAGV